MWQSCPLMIGFLFLFCLFVFLSQVYLTGCNSWLLMLGLVFKWFPMCVFTAFDILEGQFSGSLQQWSECSGLDLLSGIKIPQGVSCGIKTMKNIQIRDSKDRLQPNGSDKIRLVIMRIVQHMQIFVYIHLYICIYTYIYTHTKRHTPITKVKGVQ